MASALVEPDGFLVLCSCSHAADLAKFRAACLRGIGRAGRSAQILHTGEAGPDHPVHPALREHGPYVVVLVELPEAGKVRVVGNLLGDPHQDVRIGAAVRGVFEHHADAGRPFALLQWTLA